MKPMKKFKHRSRTKQHHWSGGGTLECEWALEWAGGTGMDGTVEWAGGTGQQRQSGSAGQTGTELEHTL